LRHTALRFVAVMFTHQSGVERVGQQLCNAASKTATGVAVSLSSIR